MKDSTKRFNPNEYQVIGTTSQIDRILAEAKRERRNEVLVVVGILFAVVAVTVLVALAVTA